jgi:hypothetical protein
MKSSVLQAIEKQLPLLSHDELRLIESLAHKLRQPSRAADFAAEMAAMAADPEIQAEIRQIEAEFAAAGEDGLEGL